MITDRESERLAYKWKALITVGLGAFMSSMDISVTNIAFPTLTEVFQTELTTVMWVGLAYSLTATSLSLIMGRLRTSWAGRGSTPWGYVYSPWV